MRIGEIAAKAEVSVQTIRFYERRGLLRKTRRLRSGYRDYAPDAVNLVRTIKHYKELGFTLKEIQELFRLMASEHPSTRDFRGRLEAKVTGLDQKIAALLAIRNQLSGCLNDCECKNGTPCRELTVLADNLKKA